MEYIATSCHPGARGGCEPELAGLSLLSKSVAQLVWGAPPVARVEFIVYQLPERGRVDRVGGLLLTTRPAEGLAVTVTTPVTVLGTS